MSNFNNIFVEIDADRSGEITKEELEEYQSTHKELSSGFAQKWLNMFDTDRDGRINYEEFCIALGLAPDAEYIEEVQYNKQFAEPNLQGMEEMDIIQIADNMDQDLQDKIYEITKDATRDNDRTESQIAKEIKEELDDINGRTWHVVVGSSQIGAKFSYIPGYYMHYKMHEKVYIVYKTPDN